MIGDSKISLQHTSVQQLSAIPEDRELVDVGGDQQQQQQDGTFTPQMIVEDEFDEPHVLIQDPAPDGGYGWVIVMASFFCNLIVDGIAYTFGLFFEIFVAHFGVSKSQVALCGSILNGFYLSVGKFSKFTIRHNYCQSLINDYYHLIGPLVSSLANRFGCRIVTIMGAIIAFIAFSLSTIAPNIVTLYITYGFLGGVGMGMIFLPAIVSVGYYFTTKRAFATGIAVCGSGVGTFLFAPFCQYLLGVTTWQNTLLILAFMILLCAGFGGLMRPLNVHAKTVLGEGDLDNQQILDNSEMRKPLLQRIAEEKRRRLLAHSNSQFLLMMQHGSLDLNDLTFTELKNRLNTMNMEPG
ncbi:Monocarboxylate transporter-like protein, partial [Euroglyphus maynei]